MIRFAPGVAVAGYGAGFGDSLAEGVVSCVGGDSTCGVAGGDDGTQAVGMIVGVAAGRVSQQRPVEAGVDVVRLGAVPVGAVFAPQVLAGVDEACRCAVGGGFDAPALVVVTIRFRGDTGAAGRSQTVQGVVGQGECSRAASLGLVAGIVVAVAGQDGAGVAAAADLGQLLGGVVQVTADAAVLGGAFVKMGSGLATEHPQLI